MVPADVLDDERYRVPVPDQPGEHGLAWLRSHVVRFSEGEAHARRRRLTESTLDALVVRPRPGETPGEAMLRAMGLALELAPAVATVAAAYQPHAATPQTTVAGDAAVEKLLGALGERSEATATTICLLVQAHAGTTAMLAAAPGTPPIPTTRRIDPGGTEVEVDLSEAPFGRGRHACPGEAIALRLVEAARSRPATSA